MQLGASVSGKYLYKYVAFDDDLNVLKVLTENKVRFSAPAAFNDPFDCNPSYISGANPQKQRPDLFSLIRAEGGPANKMRVRAQAKNKVEQAFKSGEFQAASMLNVGVLSLSRNPWHVLMWSHYARHHTGFLIEFWQPEVLPIASVVEANRYLITFPVNYVLARPKVDKWTRDIKEDVEKIFMSKSMEWKYEEEERAVDYLLGPGAREFEPTLLKSIVAGANISELHMDMLKCAVKAFNKRWNSRVELFKARIDDRQYKLLIPNFHRKRIITL